MTLMKVQSRILCLILAGLLGLLAGCADKQPQPETVEEPEPDFFEEWKAKADTSLPYVPARKAFQEELTAPPGSKTEEQAAKKESMAEGDDGEEIKDQLPSQKISVRFIGDELATVLRTLARLAGQNIIISPNVEGTINTHIENTPWNTVFMGLINSHGLSVRKENNLLHVISQSDVERQVERKSLELEEEQMAPLVSKIVAVEFSNPEEIMTSVTEMLSKDKEGNRRGAVTVDNHSRSLIIRDTSANMNRLLKLVYDLDKPTSQILIKAHIIEASKETAKALGVKWGALSTSVLGSDSVQITPGTSSYYSPYTGELTPYQFSPEVEAANEAAHWWVQEYERLAAEAAGEVFVPSPYEVEIPYEALGSNVNFPVAGGSTIGTLISLGNFVLDAQLSALQEAGEINILSSPSIATLDNNEAIIESGTIIPYPSGLDDSGNTTYEQAYATLKLTVKPHVISERIVMLDINAHKDEVDSTRSVSGVPYMLTKNATTKLIVPNKTTVVIAGLSKEKNSNVENGVPFLKDLPLVGSAFKYESTADEFEELLIFITPTILDSNLTEEAARRIEREEKEPGR